MGATVVQLLCDGRRTAEASKKLRPVYRCCPVSLFVWVGVMFNLHCHNMDR